MNIFKLKELRIISNGAQVNIFIKDTRRSADQQRTDIIILCTLKWERDGAVSLGRSGFCGSLAAMFFPAFFLIRDKIQDRGL